MRRDGYEHGFDSPLSLRRHYVQLPIRPHTHCTCPHTQTLSVKQALERFEEEYGDSLTNEQEVIERAKEKCEQFGIGACVRARVRVCACPPAHSCRFCHPPIHPLLPSIHPPTFIILTAPL